MSKKEQRKLAIENTYLVSAVATERKRNRELVEANANLRVERDATDVLLGKAMDELAGRRRA
jgi:hypothetical protein